MVKMKLAVHRLARSFLVVFVLGSSSLELRPR